MPIQVVQRKMVPKQSTNEERLKGETPSRDELSGTHTMMPIFPVPQTLTRTVSNESQLSLDWYFWTPPHHFSDFLQKSRFHCTCTIRA